MLSYTYQSLYFSEYKNIGAENFHNLLDLYVEILVIGLPALIRGGLLKEYLSIDEDTSIVRGKIDINASIKQNTLVNKKLVVLYDSFSENILLNQIIKSTILRLITSKKVPQTKRRKLFGFLPYFQDVSNIELNSTLWKKIQYNRHNMRYQFLITICQFLYQELLLSEGNLVHQKSIMDEQKLSSIYEKFVYSFYQRETDYKVSHPQIPWNLNNGFSDALPAMQTDIVLKKDNKTLIIDTKYYRENMAARYEGGAKKQKSNNLYQIFTYVNNWNPKENEIVGGMLLYAKTTSNEQPNHHYQINGNRISVLTLDLNQDFTAIKTDLLKYADEYFMLN